MSLIQVCYDLSSGKNRKRVFDALAEAAGELCCGRLLVVTNDREEETEWKGKRLSVISAGPFCSWSFY